MAQGCGSIFGNLRPPDTFNHGGDATLKLKFHMSILRSWDAIGLKRTNSEFLVQSTCWVSDSRPEVGRQGGCPGDTGKGEFIAILPMCSLEEERLTGRAGRNHRSLAVQLMKTACKGCGRSFPKGCLVQSNHLLQVMP